MTQVIEKSNQQTVASLGFELDTIIHGECLSVIKTFPNECVDLIITSPPYADNRKKSYKGIPTSQYVKWFVPISHELKRILKPEGSFVLNIKERTTNGERQTYVLELILEMKRQGWLWTEEYIWHKKNCYPGKWPNRFRDAWERCLHFTKQKKFKMIQQAVMVPMGSWAEKRLTKLSDTDRIRDESRSLSGFGKNVSNWLGKKYVYPTNVLHLATECSNRNHSAAFPISLPSWFIKLLTEPGDVVLDPFIGSGTTALACIETDRHYIGIELMEDYYKLAIEAADSHRRLVTAIRRSNGKHRRTPEPNKQISPRLL
ncbi:MAG: site-specific DNA-methyltransferase [Dehalococcoidia bacterium]|nr:site-specific DNA-methyltransferase [Dehalococcoidia bacterium]